MNVSAVFNMRIIRIALSAVWLFGMIFCSLISLFFLMLIGLESFVLEAELGFWAHHGKNVIMLAKASLGLLALGAIRMILPDLFKRQHLDCETS